MTSHHLLAAWAEYVEALASSADAITRAEDRQQYCRHLAAAAMLDAKLVAGHHSEARDLLQAERHNFGWNYLSGATGERAEQAFSTFAGLLELNHSRR